MGFENAATVFLDPLAMTFLDLDHWSEERREITIGCTMKSRIVFVSHCPRGETLEANANTMKKASKAKNGDDLRQEYDLSQLRGGVRGKYYRRATAGTNLVLIDPDLAGFFPDSEAVNRALRVLAEAAQAATPSKRRRVR